MCTDWLVDEWPSVVPLRPNMTFLDTKARTEARDLAIRHITQSIRIQIAVYVRTGLLPGAFFEDAYAAGYIHGKLLSFVAYFQKAHGLARDDANLVTGMVLLNLFGEESAREVSNALKAYARASSSDFQTGQNKGATVVAYALGAMDARSYPDFVDALDAGPTTSFTMPAPTGKSSSAARD